MTRHPDLFRIWERFWHTAESPTNLAAARILLSASALWVVLSRFDLPSVLTFPPELWANVTPERKLRFLMLFGLPVERLLYGLLHATLVTALLGVRPRLSCFLSGVLLYHFAPFETVIRTPNPYLRGLTLPTLGLLVLSFGPCGDALTLERVWTRVRPAAAPSPRYRWALALVQVLFAEIYFFAAYAKLFTSGVRWVSGDNIRGYLLVLNQGLTADPGASLGYTVARHPALCGFIAGAGIVFELAFPLVLFSVAARWILIPAAVLFHVGNSLLFRIFFQNVLLLLVFVDWTRLAPARRQARSLVSAVPAAGDSGAVSLREP